MTPEFDKYSSHYAELLRDPFRERFASGDSLFFHERKLEIIRRFFEKPGRSMAKTRWLDVGCGRGELLRLGGASFESAHGCDLSTGMINECADLNVTLQQDPEQLPYEDRTFGFVTAVCVYHHVDVEARLALTREMARMLKPGGYACIIEHNPYNPVTRAIVRRTPVDANASLLTPSMVSGLFSGAGFEVPWTTFFLYLPERIYRMVPGLERLLTSVPAGGQFATFARRPERASS